MWWLGVTEAELERARRELEELELQEKRIKEAEEKRERDKQLGLLAIAGLGALATAIFWKDIKRLLKLR
jgi:transposase